MMRKFFFILGLTFLFSTNVFSMQLSKGDKYFFYLVQNGGDIQDIAITSYKISNIDIRNEQGQTPLHVAVKKGCYFLVYMLMQRGSDVNAQDNDGNTPLHVAMKNRDRLIVELLLRRKNTHITIKNNNEKTAPDLLADLPLDGSYKSYFVELFYQARKKK